MRAPLLAWTSLGVAVAALAPGCTFLIQFDDQASCDGGLCVDATAPDVAAVDAAPDRAAPDASDAGARDAATDALPDSYAPCQGLLSGLYCAADHLKGYRGSPNDLVACDGGAIARVTFCDAGCLALPDPFPDTCDDCPSKTNGVYCGRDFATFKHPDDDDILIGCQSGIASEKFPCPHGCGSHGADASCYP